MDKEENNKPPSDQALEFIANAGNIRDTGLIPRLERSLGGGHSNTLQYMLAWGIDRGAWWVMVHSTAKSQTRLKRLKTAQ